MIKKMGVSDIQLRSLHLFFWYTQGFILVEKDGKNRNISMIYRNIQSFSGTKQWYREPSLPLSSSQGQAISASTLNTLIIMSKKKKK